MGRDVSYLRLAEVLIERLRPVLPVRMVMRIATVAEVAEMNYRHDGGVVIVSFEGDRGWTVIHVGSLGTSDEFDADQLNERLSSIADEASHETHDYYESDAEITSDAIRIWFGRVPPGSPEGSWRDVVPELAPIPLTAITSA